MLENNIYSFDIVPETINLLQATDSQLEELKNKYAIQAPLGFLREIGICLCAEQILVSEEILKFFDAIYLCSVSKCDNIDISNIFTVDEEPVKTYLDLICKHKYLSDSKDNVIPLSDAMQTASKYLATLDICAPDTVLVASADECDVSFEDSDGNKLLSLNVDNSKKLPYGYKKQNDSNKVPYYFASPDDIFFVLNSELEKKEYDDKIKELFDNSAFSKACKFKAQIGEGGILSIVADHSIGAIIFSSPENDMNELSDFVNLSISKMLISSSKENEELIKCLASEYSLTASQIATATNIPLFSIGTQNKKINIRSIFLRNLFKQRRTVTAKISSEHFESMCGEAVYVQANGKKEKLSEAFEINKHLFSAQKTEICSFTSGMNVVLNSIMTLLARGISRKNIGLTVRIGVDKNNKEEALASLLGVYRACIELTIPEKNSEIVDSEQKYIFCCAYAKKDCNQNVDIKSTFVPMMPPCSANLLSFGRVNNTTPVLMPDFQGLRNMCDYLEELFSKKCVISAKNIDGSVIDCTREMYSDEIEFSPVTSSGISENTKAQGIIVQVPLNTKINAPIIGVIQNTKDNL